LDERRGALLGDSACINTTSTVRNKQAYLWVSTLATRAERSSYSRRPLAT